MNTQHTDFFSKENCKIKQLAKCNSIPALFRIQTYNLTTNPSIYLSIVSKSNTLQTNFNYGCTIKSVLKQWTIEMRRKNNNLGHSHSLFSFQKQSKPINFGDYPHSCQLSLRNQNKSKGSAQLFNHFKKPRIQRGALEGMKLRNFTINRLLFASKLAKKREKGNKVTPSEGFSSERDSIKALLHLHQDPKIIFFSTKNQENKGEKRTSLNSCTR